VLGATIEPGLERTDYGNQLAIIPMIYQTVLRKAHQRTFNLKKRLKEVQPDCFTDADVDSVIGGQQTLNI
jgi:hypothetical protein